MTIGQNNDSPSDQKQYVCAVRNSNTFPKTDIDRTRLLLPVAWFKIMTHPWVFSNPREQ